MIAIGAWIDRAAALNQLITVGLRLLGALVAAGGIDGCSGSTTRKRGFPEGPRD